MWNETIFRSFTHGNLKSIDFEFYKSLKSAVAKRLYRFLDKHFYKRNRIQMDLRELCCEHIGLSRNYDTANMKRKLLSGVRELEERGFVCSLPVSERFIKVRPGEWNLTFDRATQSDAQARLETVDETNPWMESLVERGVEESVAANLCATLPAERIQRHVQNFDRLMKFEERKGLRNPPGFLVASIKGDYSVSVCEGDSKKSSRRSSEENRRSIHTTGIAPQQDRQSRALRKLSEQFWNSLPAPDKAKCELEAFSQGNALQRALLERGGTFASTARSALLEAYAIKRVAKTN